MTINILAFGVARDILGGASIAVELEDGATTGMLKADLEQQYPALKQLSSFMIALNNEYASVTDIVSIGDEVAIIPPVSGG